MECFVFSFTEVTNTVRLVWKDNDREGLVEVYVDGQWGGICQDNFGKDEAEVTCRQLGYYDVDADYFKRATTTLGLTSRETIFFEGLDCNGHEGSLEDCYYRQQEDNTCLSGNDVAGVRCESTNSAEPGMFVQQSIIK